MADLSKLMTSFKIGNVEVKNRYCMGPMGGSLHYGYHGEYLDSTIEWYATRARGGFGLIFGGVMFADMEVDPFNPNDGGGACPLTDPQNYIRTGAKLVEKVHAYDTKFFQQISMGLGRNYPTLYSCSENPCYQYSSFTSPELSKDQIKRKIEQMVEAAKVIKAAGIDGIEVHSIHWGYLLDQFAMSLVNHREDEYGGSLENRLRVSKEIIDGIKAECGSDYPVTMRLGLKSYLKGLNAPSFDGTEEAGRTLEEGVKICKLLESYGYDALSVDTGTYDSFFMACPPCYVPQGHGIDLYAEAKKAVDIPILAGSRMNDPCMCAQALEDGKADAFVLSRPSLADPDLPNKVAMGRPEKIRPCIGCNQGCAGKLLERDVRQTCAVNPRACREMETKINKTVNPKKVVVVGGGVAGMEAARTATMYGHDVVLFEKTDVLGGDLIAAGAHSFKKEVLQLNDWYIGELKDMDIDVRMNTEATPDMIKAEKPDTILLCVGASPIMPKTIPGIDSEKACSSIDALLGKKTIGEKIVIVGGGNVGIEMAVEYAMEGKQVTVVEALDSILSNGDLVPQQHKMWLDLAIEYYGVEIKTGTLLKEINEAGAVVEPSDGGDPYVIKADNVICALGYKKNPSMKHDLYGCGAVVYEIGNGKKPSNIMNAVGDAFEIASKL